jgi:hypothetical protein
MLTREGFGLHPFSGPYDIPILIDVVRRLDRFDMTRSLFFAIEATAVVDDWVASLRAHEIPFLLLGISPVILRPDLEAARFTAAEQIDRLFGAVEAHEGLLVETDHIWLPSMLFEVDRLWDAAPKAKGSSARRGAVWRVSLELFQAALQFQRELLSLTGFTEQCRAMMDSRVPPLAYSPEETEVFNSWSAAQIQAARKNYEQQRDDPERQVLRWRDERGRFQSG